MDTTAILIVVVTAVVPVIAMAWVRRWMRSQQPPISPTEVGIQQGQGEQSTER